MSERREARAAGQSVARTVRAHGDPLPDLLDPFAPVWHDKDLYIEWLAEHGWSEALPSAERMGADSHPANRRAHAAEAWAASAGYADDRGHVSWHWLRARGLID